MTKTAVTTKISLIAILTAAILFGCSNREDIKAADDTDSTAAIVRPDQILLDTKISLYDGPFRTTDLYADSIEKFQAVDSTLAWNLQVHFLDTLGREKSYLEADSGLVRENTNFMEVFGHVKVRTEDSAYLYTQQLKYDIKSDSITTDKFVKIIQKGDTIQGYGLVADQQLKKTRILRRVTGTLKSSKQVID